MMDAGRFIIEGLDIDFIENVFDLFDDFLGILAIRLLLVVVVLLLLAGRQLILFRRRHGRMCRFGSECRNWRRSGISQQRELGFGFISTRWRWRCNRWRMADSAGSAATPPMPLDWPRSGHLFVSNQFVSILNNTKKLT
jgi:hypothetical protein